MITQKQIQDLADYHKIDQFTIFREYLQILFLSYLYQDKISNKIFFKGGTAIRLLFGSSRFSEDLDFSCLLNETEIKKLIKNIENSLKKEMPEIEIKPLYTGISTSRFRVWYRSPEFKYPMVIRLDFNRIKKKPKASYAPLITKFPIIVFPIICHLSTQEILAEKICALLIRAKGRDFFDVWYLLEKNIAVDKSLIAQKLGEKNEKFSQKKLIEKVKSISEGQLDLELKQFLPKSQREIISMLKKQLIDKLSEKEKQH